MSKIFYDHLIKFERLEVHINSISDSHEEKHELWNIIDKLIHNRIINKILHLLPGRHHDEFANLLHEKPFDDAIIQFLKEASDEDIEIHIKKEVEILEKELLQELLEDEKEL